MGVQERKIQPLLVQGNDFMSVASRKAADAFREQLASRIESKTQSMGPEDEEARSCTAVSEKSIQVQSEGRVLNRIVGWTPNGRWALTIAM